MYIEVLHDPAGNIVSCYCADTLPVESGSPFFRIEGGTPAGYEHSRINIDTVVAMEIENSCGLKAVIDPATLEPAIVNVDRADYVMKTFKVDVNAEVYARADVLPEGMRMRALKRADQAA